MRSLLILSLMQSIIFLYFSMASVTCGQQSKNTKREIAKNKRFFQLNIMSNMIESHVAPCVRMKIYIIFFPWYGDYMVPMLSDIGNRAAAFVSNT